MPITPSIGGSAIESDAATPLAWQKAIERAEKRGGGTVVLLPNGGPAGVELTEPLRQTKNVQLDIRAYGVWVRPPMTEDGCAFSYDTGVVGYEAMRSKLSGLVIRRLDYVDQPGGDGLWVRNSNGFETENIYMFGGRRGIRVTSDGPNMHAESHRFLRFFTVGSQYGAWLESVNGAHASFDQTWFDLCDFSACRVSAVNWTENVRMDRGGFSRCQVWPTGTNQRCVRIAGDLTQAKLEFNFDASPAVVNPTGVYFDQAARNLKFMTDMALHFYGLSWIKVARHPSIGAAEVGAVWHEGYAWKSEGDGPPGTTTRLGPMMAADASRLWVKGSDGAWRSSPLS